MEFEIKEFVSIELERYTASDYGIVLSDPENSTHFNLEQAKILKNALDLMIGEIEKSLK